MPCHCSCACTCGGRSGAKVQAGAPQRASGLVKEKKPYYSYDEHDPQSQYEFQRKKRFGTKNGSNAVKECLDWTDTLASSTEEDDDDDASSCGEEGQSCCRASSCSPSRSRRSKDDDRHLLKVGERPTCGCSGRAHQHDCRCLNAHELIELKHALALQQATLKKIEEEKKKDQERMMRKSKKAKSHVCGCGCVSTHICDSACCNQTQQQPQQQEGAVAQQQRDQSPPPHQTRAAWQQQSAQSVDEGSQQDVRQDRQQQTSPQVQRRAHTKKMQKQRQHQARGNHRATTDQTPQTAQQHVTSTQVTSGTGSQSARPSTAPSTARARVGDEASRRLYEDAARTVTGGEGATHPPTTMKQGLGVTLLGSPHDPRTLHDPSQIDPVWQRRQAAKERAKRIQAMYGSQGGAGDKNVVDERQYEQSLIKQHARRLKIQEFERRHQQWRQSHPPAGATTRDYSETWMSIISGKPPFCAFGSGNTAPASGGIIYGDYLTSHNISPEKPPNHPERRQTTDEARMKRQMKMRENKKTMKRLLQAHEELEKELREGGVVSNHSQQREDLDNVIRGYTAAEGQTATSTRSASASPSSSMRTPRSPMTHPESSPIAPHHSSLSQSQSQERHKVCVHAECPQTRCLQPNGPSPDHFDLPSSSSSSKQQRPVEVRTPLTRSMAWAPPTGMSSSSGRGVTTTTRSTLADTSVRTMSGLPFPQRYPIKA